MELNKTKHRGGVNMTGILQHAQNKYQQYKNDTSKNTGLGAMLRL